MKAPILNFYRTKYLVRFRFLPQFVFWYIAQSTGIYQKTRRLLSLLCFAKATGQHGQEWISSCLADYPEFSWVRHVTDGTRIQIYDCENKTIAKLSLKKNPEQMAKEIAARHLVGTLSPQIISCDIEKGVIVEKLLNLTPAESGNALARTAFLALKERLYSTESVNMQEYVFSLAIGDRCARLQNCFATNGINSFQVTQVHGDIWSGNVFYNSDGDLVILDWEYTGTRLLSYDAWFCMFQPYKSAGMPLDAAFFAAFSDLLSMIYDAPVNASAARCFHTIHLVERYRMYIVLGMTDKREEIDYFGREIDSCLNDPDGI